MLSRLPGSEGQNTRAGSIFTAHVLDITIDSTVAPVNVPTARDDTMNVCPSKPNGRVVT